MKKLLMPALILLLFLLSACGSQDAPAVIGAANWSMAGVFADDARYPQAGIDRDGNVLVVWAQATGFYANQYHVNSGWGTPVKLSETAPGWSNLKFAVSKSGYAVAAWLHEAPGSMIVKAVRYLPESGWGEVETLGDNCWLNDLAISDEGAVYLVGEYLVGSPDSWSKGVKLIQYDRHNGWHNDSFGYGDSSTMYGFPRISVDQWGNGFLLWREGGTSPNKIYASQFSHSTLGAPLLLDTGALTGLWANIKVDDNGNAMALWLKSNDIGMITHVYACRYRAESGWGEVKQVDNSMYGSYGQTLTVGTSGNFYAGWIQSAGNYTSATDLYVSTYHAEQGWQPPRLAGAGSLAESLGLAADAHGNLFAAWLQYDPVDQLYGYTHIYTNLSRSGSAWGTPYRLPDAVDVADGPELVVAPSGRGIIIWSQATASIGGAVTYDLFFSRFE